jgi:adenylate kinase
VAVRAGRKHSLLTSTNSNLSEHNPAQALLQFVPGPVLLLGAPGVGKGTQAKALMAAYGIPQISTGDLLRANIANGTALGKSARSLMDQGQLVPNDLVNEMVADRLTQPDVARGYILDGFPRTLNQATWLDAQLTSDPAALPVVAISIIVDYEQLLHRITGRRISPAGRIYNIYSNPPRTPGICDVDGSALTQRPDDSESVFAERMKTFEALTAPVIEHYRKQGRFQEINGDHAVDHVTSDIESALKRLRTANS